MVVYKKTVFSHALDRKFRLNFLKKVSITTIIKLFTNYSELTALPVGRYIRVFRKLTTLTIMTILASEALLREKNPVTKCYPQWD